MTTGRQFMVTEADGPPDRRFIIDNDRLRGFEPWTQREYGVSA